MEKFATPRYLFLLLILLLMTGVASAHVPLFENGKSGSYENAFVIPDPGTSYAIYAKLQSSQTAHFYRIDVNENSRIQLEILVPYRSYYEKFYPSYALVGRGLIISEALVPFKIPSCDGAIVVNSTPVKPRPIFHEPFSNTTYYKGVKAIDVKPGIKGRFFVVVWSTAHEAGSYVLSSGRKEKFLPSDIRNLRRNLKKIKSGEWIINREK